MAKRKRLANPLIPNWPDVLPLKDIKDIRDHWASCVTEYEGRIRQGQTMWKRHLPAVQHRHALWVDLVNRRVNGEKIASRFYEFLRVQ